MYYINIRKIKNLINIHLFSDPKSVGIRVIESFSVKKNWKKFLCTKQASSQLTYLDGLRAVSSIWIVLIHKLYFLSSADLLDKIDLVQVRCLKKFLFERIKMNAWKSLYIIMMNVFSFIPNLQDFRFRETK